MVKAYIAAFVDLVEAIWGDRSPKDKVSAYVSCKSRKEVDCCLSHKYKGCAFPNIIVLSHPDPHVAKSASGWRGEQSSKFGEEKACFGPRYFKDFF